MQHFPFGHFPAGFGQRFIDGLIPELHELTHGSGIEVIANQDTDLIAPHFPGSLAATADVGIVHDVVVQERGGMDELDQTAEQQVRPAALPAEARAEGHEQRTDAFPAAAQNVGGDGVDQGHPGIEILLDLLLDALKEFPSR